MIRVLGIVFSLFGAFFAALSLHEHAMQGAGLSVANSLCSMSSMFNCRVVNASQYSTVFGLPLAGIGLCFYLFFFRAFLKSFAGDERKRRLLSLLILASSFAVLFSVYLFYISKFKLGVLCLYCIGMYVANLALFILAMLSKSKAGSTIGEGIRVVYEFPNVMFSSGINTVNTLGHLTVFAAVLLFPRFVANLAENPSLKNIDPKLIWNAATKYDVKINGGGPLEKDYIKGSDSSSALTVVEFSDFECPACRRTHAKVEQLIKDHPEKIRFIPKNFPLDPACNPGMKHPLHKHSCNVANIVRCAGEQGNFWSMYDLVFTSPVLDKESTSEEVFAELYQSAASVGLDVDALKACVASGRHVEKLRHDVAEGENYEIQGTPTFFIEGKKVPFEALSIVINWRLKEESGS